MLPVFQTLLYHVLNDTSLPNPGFSPFYSKEFFTKIRHVHLESPLNIFQMSEKMWYRLLLEEDYTMEETEQGQEFIKCRVERVSPNVDWEQSWRLARLSGLGPDNVSFIFKLLHQILPTQERVARTRPGTSPNCKSQRCQNNVDNLEHAMIFCQANDGVGLALLDFMRSVIPGLQPESLLSLDMNVSEDLELPLVFLISVVLNSVWNLRVSGSRVQKYLVRSQLEAKINLLRETRYFLSAAKLEEFAFTMFD